MHGWTDFVATIAFGTIGGHLHIFSLIEFADDQCVALLEEFAKDSEPIVSESCEVALSMLEFERSGKSFEVMLKKQDLLLYGLVHLGQMI